MKKIILGSLIAATVLFGDIAPEAKPINDGPYTPQSTTISKIENKKPSDDLKAIKDYLGLESGDTAKTTKTVKPKEIESKKLNVPIATTIKATLLTGYEFVIDNTNNPTSISNAELLIFSDENSCKYIGKSTYSISAERFNVSLEKRICLDDNQLIETYIKGFVTENSVIGLKAKLEVKPNSVGVAELLPGRDVELFVTKVIESDVKSIDDINQNKQ